MKLAAAALPLLTRLASAAPTPLHSPPRIAFDELAHGSLYKETTSDGGSSGESVDGSDYLWKTLQDVGMISVTGIPGLNKPAMLRELEACVHGNKVALPEFTLDDGTRRRTIGTRTAAGAAEDLLSASANGAGACPGLRAAAVPFRAAVQRAAEALAARLVGYAGGTTVLSTAAGDHLDMGAVINQGDHLEHFHSYYAPKPENSGGNAGEADATIDWHVDQGLVLLFTPGQQDGESTSGFFVQLKDGSAVEMDFDVAVDDLVIMLGDGIDQYFNPVLKQGQQLRAVPHALTLPKTAASKPRLWYGRMVLPPPAALFRSTAGQHPQEDATFGDLRDGMVRQDTTALTLGCASERMVARDVHAQGLGAEQSSSNDGDGGCDPATSIYCWMRCMAYNSTGFNPDQVTPDSCAADGEELLCTKGDLIWVPGLHDHGFGISCGNPDEMTMATLKPTNAPTPSDWVNRCSESNPASGTCIYYASWHGNTEVAAGHLSKATGLCVTDIMKDGEEVPFTEDFSNCDSIMVGTPTYNTGADDHRSETNWDDWMYEVLPNIDISGKNVAVFCTGDQIGYDEYFCDAAGELYLKIKAAGAIMHGKTSMDGYSHTATKAGQDGQFIGLMLDQRNQKDLSEGRVNAWVEQLTEEGFFETKDHNSHDHDSHNLFSEETGSHDPERLRGSRVAIE